MVEHKLSCFFQSEALSERETERAGERERERYI